MSRVLKRIKEYRPQIDVSHPIFSALNDIVGVQEKPDTTNIDEVLNAVREKSKTLAEDLTAISRMTITPTIILGGVKSNVIPARCKLTCNLRTLPNQDENYVTGEMGRLFKGLKNVRFKVCHPFSASTNSPFETKFKEAIQHSLKKALGDSEARVFPTLMPGSSDRRLLRPLGTIVYGFSLIHPAADITTWGAHCPNECTDIRSLLLKTKMMLFLATSFSP